MTAMGETTLASGSGHELRLEILPQPDDQTCGPTCLHALYRYYGYDIPLQRVIEEVDQLEGGGTVAVSLGNHALRNGFQATIYTYNLQIFDPTWFQNETDLAGKLKEQLRHKSGRKLRRVSVEYLEFVELGGKVRFEDLTASLIERFLSRGHPILTGLSATYLYNCARETDKDYDDVRGEPTGHFVVLAGYDRATKEILVADPYLPNPVARSQYYRVGVDRVISSVLLGTLTYDANLLLIEPAESV